MKKNKTVRRILLVFFVLLLLIAVFVAALFAYNKSMLEKESGLIHHNGTYVEVDGKNMNLYIEGDGDKTLVFMAGANTPASYYDFKPLYTQLSDKYKTVVIEKFGYGYSDDIDGERNLGTLLRQDREALKKAGVNAPYILCPHSASGLEAIRWAQLYPDEVEAIIGLDMGLPEQFDYQMGSLEDVHAETYEARINDENFYNFWAYTMGGYRLYNIANVFPALKSDKLTSDEKAEYKAITYHWYSKFHETSMYRESVLTENQIKDFKELYYGDTPDIPTLQFVTHDPMFNIMLGENGTEKWRKMHENYVTGLTNASVVYLDCGHYVHAESPEEVSELVTDFIERL